MSIQPLAGDPRARVHKQAIRSLFQANTALEAPPTPHVATAPTPAAVDKPVPHADRTSHRDVDLKDPKALCSKITQGKVDHGCPKQAEEINKTTQERVDRSRAERSAWDLPELMKKNFAGYRVLSAKFDKPKSRRGSS